jgi:hypothetical protein
MSRTTDSLEHLFEGEERNATMSAEARLRELEQERDELLRHNAELRREVARLETAVTVIVAAGRQALSPPHGG